MFNTPAISERPVDHASTPRKRFILTCGVVIGAGLLTGLLLIFPPSWMAAFLSAVLDPPAAAIPGWVGRLLFIFYAFFILTVCFPFLMAMGWMVTARIRNESGGALPLVSIVIPAFNEERFIHRSLAALRELDYPAYEVIVVNDGSTDFTFSLIERSFVKCIHLRRNQGKAAALNAGIARARGSIIVFSDSDSWLHPMALRYLIQGFADPTIGAVSGTVEIARANSLLKQWQMLEYTFGQFIIKVAQMGSGACVSICPGPVCAYRRDLLLAMGGFTGRTITEDFDATLEIIKRGYRVVYASRAVAFTEAPATWKDLKNQRLRWFRGHLQNFRLHRELLGTLRAGALSLYWLPVYYLFLGYICGGLELLALLSYPFLVIASGNPAGMIMATGFYFLLAELLMISGYALALARAGRLRWRHIAAAGLVYPYLFFLNWTRLTAVFNEFKGKKLTWMG